MLPKANTLDQPPFATYFAASVILGTPEQVVPGDPPPSVVGFQREVAADGLANIVLSAATPDDLRDALDEALTSESFQTHRQAATVVRNARKFRSVPGGPTLDELEARVRLLGEEAARVMAEADRVKMAIMVAFARGEAIGSVTSQAESEPLAFIASAHVPVAVKRNLLAMWHGLMAKIAIRKILRESLDVETWKAVGSCRGRPPRRAGRCTSLRGVVARTDCSWRLPRSALGRGRPQQAICRTKTLR